MVIVLLAPCQITPARADVLRVPATAGAIQQALASASPGDTLLLSAGEHIGPIVINTPLHLKGETGTIVDGKGAGKVITIAAADVTVTGISVRGSGSSLASEDSGIFITSDGDRAIVRNNHLVNNLIGIYLKGPENAKVSANTIEGSKNPRVNDRGNGIQLWNTPGSSIENNTIRYGRDGIFVTTSNNNLFRNNRLEQLRFAIHYMYTHDSEISGNISRDNHVGYALMYSDRLLVQNNFSENDRDRGLLLNYTNYSNLHGNTTVNSQKCVFIYNANHNSFTNNRFQSCQIGIHFTAGSENNRITENAFMDNYEQVKYVGTRSLQWSLHGRGNYWSDNLAYDLDNNGISDRPYRPNNLADQVLWRRPLAKLLLNSPAIQILRWAQSLFPTLFPGGVQDDAPLMTPPNGVLAHG